MRSHHEMVSSVSYRNQNGSGGPGGEIYLVLH